MSNDLKIIKKKYGEELSRMCRTMFPTLLEHDGLLSNFLFNHFEPNHQLAEDIKKNRKEDTFQKYIYSNLNENLYIDIKNPDTPENLMRKSGYILKECTTEEDIQSYKKYYEFGELICTIEEYNRLDRAHVFFAVKEDVENIKRKNFPRPEREDEYGTSVISIQFSRDESNILSIKNRYNHTVENPDATFSNNLDNIIPGLTKSFEVHYNLKENIGNVEFEMLSYTKDENDKLYKYNYYIIDDNGNKIYFCPNNIIIINNKAYKYDHEKYILMDYYLLDLVNKKLILTNNIGENDSFTNINNIKKINIINNENNKILNIIEENDNKIEIILDNLNRIISYKNNNLKNLTHFLEYNKHLENLETPNVEIIGEKALINKKINKININEGVKVIGISAFEGSSLYEIILPSTLEVISDYAFHSCSIRNISLPNNLKKIGTLAFAYNELENLFLPNSLEEIGSSAFIFNKIQNLTLSQNLKEIKALTFKQNLIKNLELPDNLELIDVGAFQSNKIENINLNNVKEIKKAAFTINNIREVDINENIKLDKYAFDYSVKVNKIENTKNNERKWKLWMI